MPSRLMLGHTFPIYRDSIYSGSIYSDSSRRKAKANTFNTKVAVWGILHTVDFMNQVAYEGTRLFLVYDNRRGGRTIRLTLPNHPTWNDLLKAGDRAIICSGNFRHIYIKHFDVLSTANEETLLKLQTGSQ